MTSLMITLPIALVMGLGSLAAFFWALRREQFEDLEGAANRILIEDEDRV
jgi:cbb3-type cytochrome oxidase maturation protein